MNGDLGGDFLCRMIERPIVEPRVLGLSKLIRIESRATTFVTGNNIRLLGDMTRRVVLCSLDPNMERPELREFHINPLEDVISRRGEYVAAALTIAKAYAVAGFPGQLPALASFEDWSSIVRSALVWLGRPDPVDTMEAARADDPATSSLRAVFAAWHAAIGSGERTIGKVIQAADERMMDNRIHADLYQALADVCEGRPGEINARKLGHWLARHKGRVVDGLKLADGYDTNAGQKSWAVTRMAQFQIRLVQANLQCALAAQIQS